MPNPTDDGWESRYDRMQPPPDVAARVALAGAKSLEQEIQHLRKYIVTRIRKRSRADLSGAEQADIQRELRECWADLDIYERELGQLRTAAGDLYLDQASMNAYARHLTEMWKSTPPADQTWHDEITDEDWRLYVEAREAQELAELRATEFGDTA